MTPNPIDFYDETTWGQALDRDLEDREHRAIDLLRGPTSPAGGRLLDVGCGHGLFLQALDRQLELSARGWSLQGVDYSEFVLERARRLPYGFRQCNLDEGIPYEDEAFDVVYAGEVIEHVYNPDLLVREARRTLRPGGSLVITTPNIQAWYNRALFAAGIQPLFYETSTKSTAVGAGPLARLKRGETPVGHLRLFNRRALLDLLESEGMGTEAVHGAIFHALPPSMQRIDRLVGRRASLASNLVVLATRRVG